MIHRRGLSSQVGDTEGKESRCHGLAWLCLARATPALEPDSGHRFRPGRRGGSRDGNRRRLERAVERPEPEVLSPLSSVGTDIVVERTVGAADTSSTASTTTTTTPGGFTPGGGPGGGGFFAGGADPGQHR